tara:strand:- start:1297 stop:1617 length:321 start_codon:yes stop_codon:yes gene_type:complete
MRGACYASGKDFEADYIEIVYQSMWEKGLRMDDPIIIQEVLKEHGLPAEEIISASQTSEIKQLLIGSTSSSVQKGNFGSPTFFVGEEMFFGKDRIEEVEQEIVRLR